ncbi:MAG: hypothetical protein ACT4P0_05485 [Panacagrimonas sp.]
MLTDTIACIPWYTREHYEEIRRTMADGAAMFRDYRRWLAAAKDNVARVEAQGYRVLKVVIEPEAFLAWCRRQGKRPDLDARLGFASELAEQEAGAT